MPAGKRRARVLPIHAPKAAPIHPFDRLHHTDTGGLIPRAELLTGHSNDAHITAYYAVAPSILEGLLEVWLGTRPRFAIDRYTFMDIGAGKGRAVLCAALNPFLEVIGIELNPGLAAIARANIKTFEIGRKANPLAPIRLIEADALATPLPSTPTLAFLFHPFEAPVLRRLIARAEQHFAHRPGEFDLLYVNAEHASVLDGNPHFERVFHGMLPMSAEDHLADLAEIAEQTEYGSTGDELCTIFRFTG